VIGEKAADLGARFALGTRPTSGRRRASVATVIAAFGRGDALVNAAGQTDRGTLPDTTPTPFGRNIAINLTERGA